MQGERENEILGGHACLVYQVTVQVLTGLPQAGRSRWARNTDRSNQSIYARVLYGY